MVIILRNRIENKIIFMKSHILFQEFTALTQPEDLLIYCLLYLLHWEESLVENMIFCTSKYETYKDRLEVVMCLMIKNWFSDYKSLYKFCMVPAQISHAD